MKQNLFSSKASLILSKETLERLSIISTPCDSQDFISLSLENDELVLVLKDLNSHYYTNNFDNKILYNGDNDQLRIQKTKIKLNGDFVDNPFGHCLQQIHTFSSWEKDNKSKVSDRVRQQFNILSNIKL